MADEVTTGLDKITSIADSLAKLSAIGLAQALGLWTAARAAIQTVAAGVAQAATQATVNAANAKYLGQPLSPAQLAVSIVRNVLPDSSGGAGKAPAGYPPPLYTGVAGNSPTAEAALSGLDANRFSALVGSTGMSYGVVDALRMYNRNTNLWAMTPGPMYSTGTPLYEGGADLGQQYGITLAELYEVIAHSDIRPEYSGQLLKLSRNTISPADAVEMTVKQIVPQEVGQNLYAAAGGIPEQFAALVDAAGDSAGVEKAVELTAHGVIDDGQLAQIVGMSRMNHRFYYLTQVDSKTGQRPLNVKWLAPYEVGEALAAGHVDAITALEWLLNDGYPQDQAAAFVATKSTATVAKVKEETAAQVLKLYGAKLWTSAEATKALGELGYTAAAIAVLLEQAESQAIIAAHNSAVSRVRAAYLVGQITDAKASADLGQLGVPAAAISAYMADWRIEAATPHTHLSAAQVGKLAEEGYLNAVQAQAKWIAMGYSADDAALLLLIYPPANLAGPGAGTPEVTAQ